MWPEVLVGDEWGGPRGLFLQSSREEEPGGKAESACLVERCVDNNEQLRSTALFSLSVLCVADKRQLEESPVGCRFGEPMHERVCSPTVSYLYTSVTDTNNQMRNKTEDKHLKSSQFYFLYLQIDIKLFLGPGRSNGIL